MRGRPTLTETTFMKNQIRGRAGGFVTSAGKACWLSSRRGLAWCAEGGAADSEGAFETALSGLGEAQGTRSADAGKPVHREKSCEQGRSDGAANVMAPLGPVQAAVREGASQAVQGTGVDVESSKHLPARWSQGEFIFPLAQGSLLDEFVAQDDGEDTGQMVVPGAGEADLRHRRRRWPVGKGTHGFDGPGDIAVLEAEKTLPALALAGDEASR